MIHQLRVCEIRARSRIAFHARFRDHAMRIMARHGFTFRAMWEAETSDRIEFVTLLEWPNDATRREAWDRFANDPEWIEIDARTTETHGPMIGSVEDRILRAVPYSPTLCPPAL